MDYRNLILADLRKLWDEKGPGNYFLADTLTSFKAGDQRYLVALNQLLAEKVVVGIQGPDERIAVALNPETLSANQPAVNNNVTVNLGAGATFTGPFAVGQTISQTYAATKEASGDQLRDHLEQLVLLVGKLVETIDSSSEKVEISEKLSTFVQQANKETPSKSLLQFTGEGLIEAAKAVASMAGPITTAVIAVLALVV